jgi:CHAT domain-containing protein/tetratricopeptide (TPR) repeat protein
MRGLLRPLGCAVALIVLSIFASSAQQPPASQADIARQLNDARQLVRDRKLEDATASYQAAVAAARSLGLEAEEAEALCGLGEALIKRNKYGDAEPPLRDCLAKSERLNSLRGIGRAAVSLSQVAELTGRYSDAAAFADRAVAAHEALQDPRGRATAHLQLLRVRQFTIEERQALVDSIVADARLESDPDLEAEALHNMGDYLFAAGRFEEAFEALTRARDLHHQTGSFGDEGTVLNSLGRVYRAHGRLDEALKCQMQALALHEKYGTPFELMQSHNAVAVVLNMMGSLTAAREHYEQALTIARQSGSPRIQDSLNANLAMLLVGEGEYEKSAGILEEIIAHGLDPFTGMRYSNLSMVYVKLNRPKDAISAAEHAVAACGTDQRQCLDSLGNLAAAHAEDGDAVAARADLRKALEVVEGLRSKLVPADFLKQNFHEAQRDLYSASIAIDFSQHDDRESLETAEMASTRAFLDLLAGRGQSSGAGGAPELTWRGAMTNGNLPSATTAAPATAADLVRTARRLHSTMVVYWPADDALFIWVVRGDGRIVSRRVEVSRARLVELIARAAGIGRTSLEDSTESHAVTTRGSAQLSIADQPDRHAWRQLYEQLIAPIRAQLPRTPGALLTIVPHGILMNVSFAALQDHSGRYLLEDYAIHYAPAGAVLQYTAGMRHPDARVGPALLVADPATVQRSKLDPPLPPLPGAREEAAKIAAFIPRKRLTLLEGGNASEPRVIDAAADKTIVHFATHAIVRDDAPNDSYLAFGPGGSSTTGLLTAGDVYHLRLKADLVVLSACRSGGGRITGDGVATFARAFMYAGTPSLVVSLWDVADEPTSRLLPAFYRTWLAGASKARSLRRAQLQLLADLRAGAVRVETRAGPIVLPEHPMFWAGFVLIGEPD